MVESAPSAYLMILRESKYVDSGEGYTARTE
jgi:hypothetical protein